MSMIRYTYMRGWGFRPRLLQKASRMPPGGSSCAVYEHRPWPCTTSPPWLSKPERRISLFTDIMVLARRKTGISVFWTHHIGMLIDTELRAVPPEEKYPFFSQCGYLKKA